MKEKAAALKCEELEPVSNASDWTNGSHWGFGIGLGILTITAGSVTYLAFT